ncbi:MAG: glycosyltransferase [Verrucomicrobia bacterium]|nr:glycosyltransferase [Verrucomicrobiota bacterium]MCH8529066.1 glycosyltransferase [Kiritimatiellia bacterium]
MQLSLLIPAYNERNRIAPMLEAYSVSTRSMDCEILIIVNGSSDGTEALIETEFLPRFPQLRLIVIPEPVGKGGALIRGMMEARGDTIAFVDADGSTAPESLFELVHALRGDEILVASRWLPESEIDTPQSRSRRVGSRIFNRAVRLLFGLRLTDTQCGAKVMSRAVMQTVLPRIGATQWAFDVDLLYRIRRAGFPVREQATRWTDVSGSKVHPVLAPLGMLLAISRLRLLYSPLAGLVHLWDRTLGIRLFRRRLARMKSIRGTAA